MESEKKEMVTLVVAIEEELLRRVEASEGIMDEGLHVFTCNETGRLLHKAWFS